MRKWIRIDLRLGKSRLGPNSVDRVHQFERAFNIPFKANELRCQRRWWPVEEKCSHAKSGHGSLTRQTRPAASKKPGRLSISSFCKMRRWIHLSLTNVTSRVSCFVPAPLAFMLTSHWIDWNLSEFSWRSQIIVNECLYLYWCCWLQDVLASHKMVLDYF